MKGSFFCLSSGIYDIRKNAKYQHFKVQKFETRGQFILKVIKDFTLYVQYYISDELSKWMGVIVCSHQD